MIQKTDFQLTHLTVFQSLNPTKTSLSFAIHSTHFPHSCYASKFTIGSFQC